IGSHRVGEVYVTLPIRTYYSDIETISNACAARRIPLRLVAELFPLKVASNELMYVDDVALLSLSAVPEERIRLAMKRAIDFLASTLLLLVLFVPLFIVALLIKADSRGPIFFAQERVGQNRRRFSMLKFRSMVVDAEARRAGLDALNEADGPVFKIRNDPRITRVGRFIRKYSVDEFPQLINVWLGQMSLVGPRPPLASEVEKYSWDQRRRLSVKPGMTGLWQVSGRSNVGFEEWVALDLQYIDTWSVWSDFKILLKTFGAVVRGRGAA
ncbi:MAG: exopolysaccharide biosynthesis polyprenyl glycosylphosphotransferase, partial [Candidatus Hydrogenedentota bacterium]